MDSIKRVLKQAILTSTQPKLFGASLIVGLWEKTLLDLEGPKAIKKTKALSYRGGVLKVGVYSKPWLLYLRIRQEVLVMTLNQKLNTTLVKSLRVEKMESK